MPEVVHVLQSVPKTAKVVVRMKDPYGMGPNADVPIECDVEAIDVDSAYGIFLRVARD